MSSTTVCHTIVKYYTDAYKKATKGFLSVLHRRYPVFSCLSFFNGSRSNAFIIGLNFHLSFMGLSSLSFLGAWTVALRGAGIGRLVLRSRTDVK